MSQENVDVVCGVIDAYNKRELDAALRHMAPDVELDFSRSQGPDAGIYRGHEGVRRFFLMFDDVFASVALTSEEVIEDGNYVVVPNIVRAVGRDGVAVEARSAWAVTLRDALVVRLRLYQDPHEALKAVALAE